MKVEDVGLVVNDLTESQRERLNEISDFLRAALTLLPYNYEGQLCRDSIQVAIMWAASAFMSERKVELRAKNKH